MAWGGCEKDKKEEVPLLPEWPYAYYVTLSKIHSKASFVNKIFRI